MKGDKEILKALNKVLFQQLTAINQYFMHGKILKNKGLEELAEHIVKASIREMKYADDLMERILFLQGLPNLQDLGKLMIGETVEEMLASDLKMQHACRNELVAAVSLCEEKSDYISRELLNKFMDGAEEYIDWLETQESLIKDMGLGNYLQSSAQDD